MKNKLLQIKKLEAGYGELKVLHGVDIDVNEKEIVAIIGPNGSGKSTIIKSVLGLVKASKGTITFNKKRITNKSPDEIVRLGIAYVPQGRMVFQTMTVEENLEMGAYVLDDKEVIKKRMQEVYEKFPDLKSRRNQRATFLSGGQQQMLSIGRALMLKPKLLLLDEPSLGLAPKTMADIFKKIIKINKQEGTTILIVEQNARMALEICDKAYVLETGKIAMKGTGKIANKKRVKELYLGS